jgi:ssDNA-binding Zn-finger/Zn-ribbon topoisomerase 1
MVEARAYSESEGTFTEHQTSETPCPKCGAVVYIRVWESSCGGYEDEKHACSDCTYVRWIDGGDS